MILENIKIKKIFGDPYALLRIFLGFVFLFAGIFRIFNPELVRLEFIKLSLPLSISWVVIVFEICAGLGLLLNRFTKQIYISLLFFLGFILFFAVILKGSEMFKSAGELFSFDLNPTDVFLHFVFLLIVFILIFKRK